MRGFSLLELVVVIVIAAILAALAIPRLTDRESRAAWFHEQAKAAVRYAQRQAVAQRRVVYVDVRPARIELCYAVPTPSGCASPLTQITTGQPYVVEAPDGVVLSPVTTFAFNGLGQPQPVGGVTLSVGGRAIVVAAESGYVR